MGLAALDDDRLRALEIGQGRIEGTMTAIEGLVNSVDRIERKVDGISETVGRHDAGLSALLTDKQESSQHKKAWRAWALKLSIPLAAALAGALAAAAGHAGIAALFRSLGTAG